MSDNKKNEIYIAGEYDVIVVGAGHAGCEASLASARMGMKTLMITMNLDSVAMMPCNPSIGGTGKGHLVREIDALGGQMALNIDKTMIQSKMLNTSKGPAVLSLRAQADKNSYHREMKITIEKQKNLDLKQGEIIKLDVKGSRIAGVLTKTGIYYSAKACILCTGTYLMGKIHIGNINFSGGPSGLFPAVGLSESLKNNGIELLRFKTGTPARVHRNSLNFDNMEIQRGDAEIVPFSFMTDKIDIQQIPCYLTYTSDKTHQLIKDNLHKSPLYAGSIDGVGPRYCPSIEDKVVRFSDKDRHQLFIEPEGIDTEEMYIQGLSTSLPEEVQLKMYRTVEGMEKCEIMRPAYAIEYDCINPLLLKQSLELKSIEGLFSAGQVNGSSGYEEAAAQGIIAGINAVQKIREKEPLVIDRSEGYIGILIDDLVTKGTSEPYRMMTSRAEYRLILRQDNADLRLTEKGFEVGLVSKKRYDNFCRKKSLIFNEIERIKLLKINPSTNVNNYLESVGASSLKRPVNFYDLLKRTEIKYEMLEFFDENYKELSNDVIEQIEIQIKYEGYVIKQLKQIEQFKKMESRKLGTDIDYNSISGLRLEARQKLSRIIPETLGQASRISGVSPADISVLLVYLEQQKRKKEQSND